MSFYHNITITAKCKNISQKINFFPCWFYKVSLSSLSSLPRFSPSPCISWILNKSIARFQSHLRKPLGIVLSEHGQLFPENFPLELASPLTKGISHIFSIPEITSLRMWPLCTKTRPTNLCMCSLHISSKWLIKLGIVSVAGKKKGEQPSRGQRSRFSEKTRMRKCVRNPINSLYLRPQHVTSRAGWSNCTCDMWNIGQSWNTSFSRKPFDIATKSFIFIPWLIVVRLVCHQGLQMKRIGRHNLHSKMMPG